MLMYYMYFLTAPSTSKPIFEALGFVSERHPGNALCDPMREKLERVSSAALGVPAVLSANPQGVRAKSQTYPDL